MAKKKVPLRNLRIVIGYIRVSMERTEMYSPAQQKTAIIRKARILGIDPKNIIWVEDIDESGTTFDNRKILLIVNKIRDGEADGVIVLDTSRWGRNSELTKRYRREIASYGGHYISATQGIDPRSEDAEVVLGFHELMDEQYSYKIGKNWERAHENRRERKLPHNGRIRFGYKRCPRCKRNPQNKRAFLFCEHCKGVLQVDAVTGPILEEAYLRRSEGEGVRSIASDFAKRGVKSVAGNTMSPSNLRDMLDTGFGAGLLRWNVADFSHPRHWEEWALGAHEAVIDIDVWKKYVAMREAEASGEAPSREPKYSASGMVRCGALLEDGSRCMASMISHKGRRVYEAYRCPRQRDRKDCPGVTASEKLVEKYILEWLSAHANGDEEAIRVMQQCAEVADRDSVALAQLEQEAREIEAKQQILVKELLKGAASAFPEKMLQAESAELSGQLSFVQSKIAVLRETVTVQIVPASDKFAGLLKQWPRMTVAKKRLALRMVIDHVLVTPTPGSARSILEIVPKWAPPHQRYRRRKVTWRMRIEEETSVAESA